MTEPEIITISKQRVHPHDTRLPDNDLSETACYQIAGQSVVFSSRVESLNSFHTLRPESNTQIIASVLPVGLLDNSNAKQHYQGMAPFNGSNQAVTYWRQHSLGQIDIGGDAVCQIDLQQQKICLLNEKSFDQQLNIEVVTGPALIVLLALKGVFCLHASAVATDIGNIAFVAESGVGKSTLAMHHGTGWQQLADDILPITRTDPALCMQAFPQLKLANCVPEQRFPEMPSVDLIVRLSSQQVNQIEFRKLPRREALLEVVRHTVASKMFDADLLHAQMQFAQQLSQAVPMIEMCYPRDLSAMDELRKAIIEQGSKVV